MLHPRTTLSREKWTQHLKDEMDLFAENEIFIVRKHRERKYHEFKIILELRESDEINSNKLKFLVNWTEKTLPRNDDVTNVMHNMHKPYEELQI